jgi:hypothetical protein
MRNERHWNFRDLADLKTAPSVPNQRKCLLKARSDCFGRSKEPSIRSDVLCHCKINSPRNAIENVHKSIGLPPAPKIRPKKLSLTAVGKTAMNAGKLKRPEFESDI